MIVKQLHAHFLVTLGNYNNERIGFTVTLEEGESAQEVVSQLREKAKEIIGETAENAYERRDKLLAECNRLERKLKSLTDEWNSLAEFLRAQGIKPEAPSMPILTNLLSAAKEVQQENIAEFTEEDEEFEENGEY